LRSPVFVRTITDMSISYDHAKDALNQAKHGVSLAEAERMDGETATIAEDTRHDYGEERLMVTGYIGVRLHVMIVTPRDGGYRVISLRKANARERTTYERKRHAQG